MHSGCCSVSSMQKPGGWGSSTDKNSIFSSINHSPFFPSWRTMGGNDEYHLNSAALLLSYCPFKLSLSLRIVGAVLLSVLWLSRRVGWFHREGSSPPDSGIPSREPGDRILWFNFTCIIDFFFCSWADLGREDSTEKPDLFRCQKPSRDATWVGNHQGRIWKGRQRPPTSAFKGSWKPLAITWQPYIPLLVLFMLFFLIRKPVWCSG